MYMRFLSILFFVQAVLLSFLMGCQHQPSEAASVSDSSLDSVYMVVDTVVDTVSVAAETKPIEVKTKARKQQVSTTGTAHQVYVTGYNSFGRLWGYVTLKGDKGTGVIHDAEENHYSVQCTRHGDELFAVDQNSRQYVLKFSE